MANSVDFFADQVEVNKIVVNGNNGQSTNALLIYGSGAQGLPLNRGYINTSIFPQAGIGKDVFFYVSGAIGSKNTNIPGLSVFGGDLHVSGNFTVNGSAPSGGSHTSGTRSLRPSGSSGDTYYATDEGVLYYFSDTDWFSIFVESLEPLISEARISFDFDESSGSPTLTNLGAAGGTLDIVGSPQINTVSALHNRALVSPTNSDYYEGLDSEQITGSFTLEAWIQGGGALAGSAVNSTLLVVGRRNDIGSWTVPDLNHPDVAAGIFIATTNTNPVSDQLILYNGISSGSSSPGTFIFYPYTFNTNTWNHVVLKWDEANLYGYLNGSLFAKTSSVGPITDNSMGRWSLMNVAAVGTAGAPNLTYNGKLQGVRYYNIALSEDEIQRRYLRTVGLYKGT